MCTMVGGSLCSFTMDRQHVGGRRCTAGYQCCHANNGGSIIVIDVAMVMAMNDVGRTCREPKAWFTIINAEFTPGHMLPDTSCIHLLPSTCFLYRRQNCRQFVARLLLDTKGYKSTVT